MKAIYVYPEMVEAGMEALRESRQQGMGEYDTAVAVFLSMRAVEAIAALPTDQTVVH